MLQQGNDSQISFLFILIPLILFVNLTVESRDSINEGKNDIQVLLEKQDSQFRALTETLKDSLNDLGSALGLGKLSKSIDEEIDKLNSTHTSRQLEDLNRERLRLILPPVTLVGNGG